MPSWARSVLYAVALVRCAVKSSPWQAADRWLKPLRGSGQVRDGACGRETSRVLVEGPSPEVEKTVVARVEEARVEAERVMGQRRRR